MARTKTKTETETKTHTLTKEQIQQLKDFAVDMMNIRRTLEGLEGEDDISTIMFKIGATYNVAEVAETAIDEFLEQFNEEECFECGDDF